MRGSTGYWKSYLLSVFLLLMLLTVSASSIIPKGDPSETEPQDRSGEGEADGIFQSNPSSVFGSFGNLEWAIDLLDPADGRVSTPCIADLDMDGYQEILALTENGVLMAYNHNGTDYWESPLQLNIASIGDFEDPTTGNFEPPRFFPSPVVEDITGDPRPEILICAYSGLVCLDSDGVELWKAGDTYGCYFGTPCITDLNGTFGGSEDLEIIVTSSGHNNTNWIEVISGDGDVLSRNWINTSLILGSTCVAQDLQGSAWDGPWQSMDPQGNDPDTEIVFSSFGNFINIIDPSYEDGRLVMNITANATGGNYNLATPVVMNIEGSADCEIIAGTSEGSGAAWDNWTGRLVVFNTTGEEIWDYDLPGNGSAIMSSPVVMTKDRYYNDSDDHLRSEYDIIFGSDDGFIYCLNSSSRDVRWKFWVGERIRSSPAVFDFTGNEDYAVVVGTDSGRIICFELDPSEGIDHGVPYPGDGPILDVLWIYKLESPIGFSSPVVSDIDRDRMPEVLIGDSDGNLFCISGGKDTETYQSEWTSFQGNGNRTGYSGFVDRYRVDFIPINTHCKHDPSVKPIKPGEFITFNITLGNKCKWLDKEKNGRIDLQVENDHWDEGIVCWLDTPSYKGDDNPPFVILQCGDIVDLFLHVYFPLREFRDRGKLYKFNITAVLDGHPLIWDDIDLSAWVDVKSGIEMEFDVPVLNDPDDPLNGSKTLNITNGGEITADLIVRNTGIVNDTFDIDLPEPPDLWDWYFVDTGSRNISVNLSTPMFKNESHITTVVLPVTISCHPDAEGSMIESIEASAGSRFMESLEKPVEYHSDILYIRVNETRDLYMGVNEPVVFAVPEEMVRFAINLTNTGNTLNYTAHMGFTNLTPEWGGSFSENPVNLIRMESQIVYLDMTVPMDRPAGEVVAIDVTADLHQNRVGKFRIGLQVVVEQAHSVRTHLTEYLISGYPGDILFSEIAIENLGNGLEEIDLHVEENDLFEISFTMGDGIAFKPVILSPGDNLSLRSRIYFRDSVLAGTYSSPITIVTTGGNISLDQRIKVKILRSLQITSLYGQSTLSGSIRPGGSAGLIINLTNTGNGMSTFRLDLDVGADREDPGNISRWHSWDSRFAWISRDRESLAVTSMLPGGDVVNTTQMDPEGRFGFFDSSELDHIDVVLQSGESVYLGVEVDFLQFSLGDRSRSIEFDIKGRPLDGGGGGRVECILSMLLPDLNFVSDPVVLSEDGAILTSGVEGETVVVRVSVRNIGKLDAEQVRLALYVDDEYRDEMIIPSIGSGESFETIEFNLSMDGGNHVLRLEIDPDNDIVEDRDQFSNGGALNNNEVSIGFGVQGSEGSGIESLIAILIVAVPILILVVVVIFLAKRFGGEKPGYEE